MKSPAYLALVAAFLGFFVVTAHADPPTVTTLDAFPLTATSATLRGLANPKGTPDTWAWFEWGVSTSYGWRTDRTSVGGGTANILFNAAVNDLPYAFPGHYRAVVSNSTGVVYGADRTFDLPSVPVVSTLAATQITGYAATLQGDVMPGFSGMTTVWFEWGTSTNYSESGGHTMFLPGGDTERLSVPVMLSISQTHHYRVVAMNDDGISYGEDRIIISVPQAETLAADTITAFGGTFHGRVLPRSDDTVVWFEWGQYGGYQSSSEPVALGIVTEGTGDEWRAASYAVTGLVAGVNCQFRVVARNSISTIYGAPQSFYVIAPPSAETSPADVIGLTQGRISGTVNPNGHANAIAWFEWGTTTNYGATTPINEVLYVNYPQTFSTFLTGLAENSTYHYRLVCYSTAGRIAGQDQQFTTYARPVLVTLPATDVTDGSAVLHGTVNPMGLDTTVYFWWSGSSSSGFTASTNIGNGWEPVAVEALIAGLGAGQYHDFRILAVNAAGYYQGNSANFFTRCAPQVVTGQAMPVTSSQAVLNAYLEVNGGGTCSWFEWGTTTSYGNTAGFTNMADAPAHSPFAASVEGLASATLHHFRAVASNDLGVAYGDDNVFFTPGAPVAVTQPPEVPVGGYPVLHGEYVGNGEVTYAWFEWGTTTNYGNILNMTMTWPEIRDVPVPISAWFTIGVPYETYHYRVVASNSLGVAHGDDASFFVRGAPVAFISPPADITPTGATFRGSYLPGTEGEVDARFQWRSDHGEWGTVPAIGARDGTNVVSVSAAWTNGTPGRRYWYLLIVDSPALGTGSSPEESFLTPMPPSFYNVYADGLTNSGVTLRATAFVFGAPADAWFEWGTDTNYVNTVGFTNLADAAGLASFEARLENLTPATPYWFRAVASNAWGVAQSWDVSLFNPGAPMAVTQPPEINTGYAILQGEFAGNGLETAIWFEWGATTNYGNIIGLNYVAGSQVTLFPSWAYFYEGQPYNAYHYRAVASNSVGVVYGEDSRFFIPGPPLAYSLPVTNITPTSATFEGWYLPGTEGEVDARFVWSSDYGDYGELAAPGIRDGTNAVFVNATLSNGIPGMAYTFWLTVNAPGQGTAYSEGQRFFMPTAAQAYTQGADEFTPSGATLHAWIVPGGSETTGWFEWGTNGVLSFSSEPTSVGSGMDGKAFLQPVTGLAVGIPYQFRAAASNMVGVTYGEVMEFTVPVPPHLTTLPAGPVYRNSAVLRAECEPNSAFGNVWFEWGTTTDYGNIVDNVMRDAIVIAELPGLPELTTYHYRVVGQTASGILYGEDQVFTTLGAPSAVTLPPDQLTESSARFLGEIHHNGSEFMVWFEYGATTNYGANTLTTDIPWVGPQGNWDTNDMQVVGITVPGLVMGNTYHYRVIAGWVEWVDESQLETFPILTGQDVQFTLMPPPSVVVLPVEDSTTTSAMLRGTVNTLMATSAVVWFEWADQSQQILTPTPPIQVGSGVTEVSFALSNLVMSTTYLFELVGSNSFGVSRSGQMAFVTAGPPRVSTYPPDYLGGTAVNFRGHVDTGLADTAVWFEWGATTNLGTITPAITVQATANTTPVSIPAQVPRDGDYWCQLVASNSYGMTRGEIVPVSTLQNAAVIVTLPPTLLDEYNATFHGTVLWEGEGEAWCWFEWGSDTNNMFGTWTMPVMGGPDVVPIDIDAQFFEDERLQPGTICHVRLVVMTPATYMKGNLVSFEIPLPLHVEILPVTDVTTNSVVLHGLAASDGREESWAWFTWDSGLGWSNSAPVSIGSGTNPVPVTVPLDGLISGRNYTITLVVSNLTRTADAWGSFTTMGPPCVSHDGAWPVTAAGVTLNGRVWPNGAETRVWFEWGTTTNYGQSTIPTNLPAVLSQEIPCSAVVTEALAGPTYYFRVAASNSFGVVYSDVGEAGPGTWHLAPFEIRAVSLMEDPIEHAGLMGLGAGRALWGDYNNDGHLDIAFVGFRLQWANPAPGIGNAGVSAAPPPDFSEPWSCIAYNNGDGTFTQERAGLPLVYEPPQALAQGDFDNDGFLDLVIAGHSNSGRVTRFCRNLGNRSFSELNPGFTGVSEGALAAGDFNNDGRLDLLLNGVANSGRVAQVWFNAGANTFTNANAPLTPVSDGSIAVADFDNDGALDFVYCGINNSEIRVTKLYRNLGNGTFEEMDSGLPGLSEGTLTWGDANGDGWPDLLLAGNSQEGFICQVWANNGTGIFSVLAPLIADGGVVKGAAWMDYDNDGIQDIVADIEEGFMPETRIYRNTGVGEFMQLVTVDMGVHDATIAVADANNDGRQDILVVGTLYSSGQFGMPEGTFPALGIIGNNNGPNNSTPTPPAGLTATISAAGALLAWNAASDAQTTNASGLTYNVRIGTAPGAANLLAPDSDITSGFRRVAQAGNAQHRLSLALTNLPGGLIYWSVQALDGIHAGSAFSAEGSFYMSGQPIILQSAAAAVTATSARLASEIDPGGSTASAWFEWGLTTSYGSISEPQPAGSGMTPATVSQIITNLAPGLFHHFRAVASNANGVVYGPDQSFFTSSALVAGDGNGDGIVDQSELDAVMQNYWPNSPWLQMTNVANLGTPTVQFQLPSTTGWSFTVQASTNLTDWQSIGTAMPLFQFTDPAVTNQPMRYYRLQWP